MMKQGHQVSPLNTEGSIWLHSQPRITIGSCGQNQQCLFLLITTLLPRISFLVKCTWRSVTQQGQAVEYTSVLIAAILREHRFFFSHLDLQLHSVAEFQDSKRYPTYQHTVKLLFKEGFMLPMLALSSWSLCRQAHATTPSSQNVCYFQNSHVLHAKPVLDHNARLQDEFRNDVIFTLFWRTYKRLYAAVLNHVEMYLDYLIG